jgi:hypothetical protein
MSMDFLSIPAAAAMIVNMPMLLAGGWILYSLQYTYESECTQAHSFRHSR